MEAFFEFNRGLHIVFGFLGLAAFWVPAFTRKGSPLHKRAGRVFRYSAIVVVTAAGIAVVLNPVYAMMIGHDIFDNPEALSFLVFLGYLALVTGGILSHGIAVLHHKRDLTALDTPYRRFIAASMIAASIFIVAWALYWRPENAILLYALSPLGIINGFAMRRVMRGHRAEPQQWKLEHLDAMIGCGIAFHTAFAVFGLSRFTTLNLPGAWQVLPWILPAAIGIPATILLTRYYRNNAVPARP